MILLLQHQTLQDTWRHNMMIFDAIMFYAIGWGIGEIAKNYFWTI
jgi:hypothetical protein